MPCLSCCHFALKILHLKILSTLVFTVQGFNQTDRVNLCYCESVCTCKNTLVVNRKQEGKVS